MKLVTIVFLVVFGTFSYGSQENKLEQVLEMQKELEQDLKSELAKESFSLGIGSCFDDNSKKELCLIVNIYSDESAEKFEKFFSGVSMYKGFLVEVRRSSAPKRRSCQYPVGSCSYYIYCNQQWPPTNCTGS